MAFEFLAPYVASLGTQAIGSVLGRAFQPSVNPTNYFEGYSNFMRGQIDQYYQPIIDQGLAKIGEFYDTERNKAIKSAAARGIYSGGAIENYLAETADKERKKAIEDFMSQISAAKADVLGRSMLQAQQQAYAQQGAATQRGFDIADYLTSALSDIATSQFVPQATGTAAGQYAANQNTVDLYNSLMQNITGGSNAINPFNVPRPQGLSLTAPIR